MRQYETTFIVNPQTDDATIDAQVKAVTDIITSAGGKIVYENLMGTRRMAYPIKKLSQGYYANFIFDAPKTVVAEIDRHIRMNEAYLRHLTIVYEGSIPDPNAPPTEEYRGFGRPRGGQGDRPYGRRDGGRDGGRDGYRDRGRPEPAARRPEGVGPPKDAPAASAAPATDAPAPEIAPAKPEPVAAPETTPEASAATAPTPAAPAAAAPPAPTPEPVKAVEPEPTPEPAAEPTPEPPAPPPPVTPPEPTRTEEYREDEEL